MLWPTRAGDEWYDPPPGSPDAEDVTFIATYVCKLTALATAQLLSRDPVSPPAPCDVDRDDGA